MGRAHEVRAAAMAKTAAAKSKLYSKWGKELYVAAKDGVPDPEMNPTLKRKIERAKKEQVPADVIKRAIDKAKGGNGESYIATQYEGMSKGNSMIIVDCLTDNVNRTFTEVRTAFNKTGSTIGSSVMFMFKHQAVFAFNGLSEDDVLEALLEADCEVEDVVTEDDEVVVYAPYTEYNKIRTALTNVKSDIDFSEDEVTYIPTSTVELDGEDLAKFQRLLDALEENEDVQNVYHNVKLPEEETDEE